MSMILTFIILTTISVSSIWYTLVKSPGHFKVNLRVVGLIESMRSKGTETPKNPIPERLWTELFLVCNVWSSRNLLFIERVPND